MREIKITKIKSNIEKLKGKNNHVKVKEHLEDKLNKL